MIACDGDRSLTRGRAAILADVCTANGADVVSDVSLASHVAVGTTQKYCLPEGAAPSCIVVTTEWIVDSVATGKCLPPAAYCYTSFVEAPTVSELPAEHTVTKDESARRAGYVPVFFTEGFACQKDVSISAPENPNQFIIDELTKLKDIYEKTGDHWRKYSYNKVIGILKRHLKPIRGREDVVGIHGIGENIALKIEEIVKTGTSEKAKFLESSEEVKVVTELGLVWGVGPATAKKLFLQGVKGIADLRARTDTGEDILGTSQLVGLKYVEAMQIRIPRAEVAMIETVVRASALAMNANLTVTTCGSYRRAKSDSGDVDILVCDRTGGVHDGILEILVHTLKQSAFLLDELSGSYKSRRTGDHDSWMGMCCLPLCGPSAPGDPSVCQAMHTADGRHIPRRLDIKVYAKVQYPFAILYFTGSDYFNRSMRLFCQKKDLSLSDKDLRRVIRVHKEKVHEGECIPCETEEDIFRAVGLEYKKPADRSV